MKFSTWQLVAILAILFAAIVCSAVFAPGAVAVVTGMATTLFAALFISHDKDKGDPPPPNATGTPTLTLVGGALLALALVGCATFTDVDKAVDANAKKLEACRGEARAAYYLGETSEDEALAIYDACVKRGWK